MVEISQQDWDRLISRVSDLEQFRENHAGSDESVSNPFTPHPNQKINSMVFGGGGWRAGDEGLQFSFAEVLNNEKIRGVFFVPGKHVDDPMNENQVGVLMGYNNTLASDAIVLLHMIDDANTRYAQLVLSRGPSNFTSAILQANDQSVTGNAASLSVLLDNVNDLRYIEVDAPFKLDSATADPSGLGDGSIFYRSDTDKLRLRANGAWVDVGGGLLWNFSNGDINVSPGQVMEYNGTGGHTFTLVNFNVNSIAVIKNLGTGVLTVARNGSGTVDGQTSITLAPFDSLTVYGKGVDTVMII